mmetsp:Transcript_11897/g.30360  ORF Transcript_11897/g.30360 Transcript_11897/m.30360 type:complete len:307 (+) Transcript_11897:151-1071(+)
MFAQVKDIAVDEQVTELLRKVPNISALDPNRRFFQVLIKDNVALRINLPARYPDAAPVMTVTQPLHHPWVLSNGVVWSEEFQSLHYKFDSLALVRLVDMVLKALQPASVGTPWQKGVQPLETPAGRAAAAPADASTKALSRDVQGTSSEDFKADIEKLSVEELRALLTDKEAYATFLSSLKAMGGIEESIKEVISKNASLAQSNLEKQQQVAELKNQMAIIRSTEVPEVRDKYDKLAKEHNSILKNINTKTLREELSKAAEDMDQSSDLLAQQLVHKDISVDQFVQQYCLQRENFHRRTMVMQTLN